GNGATIDWTLNVSGANPLAQRPRFRDSITFDNAGNLYWKTHDPGNAYLCSASPTGTLRWLGNASGTPYPLGGGDAASPVVGDGQRVYILTSDGGGGATAFSKSDGDLVWATTLAGSRLVETGERLT